MRRAHTGWCDDHYDVPSGHIDGGEYLTVAVAREAHEELGITFPPSAAQLIHLAHFIDSKQEYLNAAFKVEEWEGEPQNMEPEKHDNLGWFDLDDLPENLTPGTRAILESYKAGNNYSEITLEA